LFVPLDGCRVVGNRNPCIKVTIDSHGYGY
jgi:hypothetical protein